MKTGEASEIAPLAGVRVVDFGQYIAGPLAAMILADLGADVVRVDPPAGPSWDHPATNILNRNKRSIALDLKVSEDAEIARRLIATADVVIENFRPGVMERFGLGPRELTAAFPRLVYLSLPGFASADAEARNLPAWEGIVSAAIGQFTDMSLTRVLMGKTVSFSPLPLASAYGAVLGAMSVVLALYSRTRSGRGDVVEVPLAAALSEGLAVRSMHVDGLPTRYRSLREREIERRRQAGAPFDLNYDELQSYLHALYRTYQCADDRRFYIASSSQVNHPKRALALLGLLEEVTADGIPMFDPYLPTRLWPSGSDCTLGDVLSLRWNTALTARIAAVFEREPSSHWEALFGDRKVPGAAVRTTQEWLQEDHPLEAGLLIDVEDHRYGLMRQPANVAWLGGPTLNRTSPRPASALDSDRERILQELREAEAHQSEVAEPQGEAQARSGWLDGVTILDLANVLAGPIVSGTLQRFGARVIRLEPVRPPFGPFVTMLYGLQSNRGKRSAIVDIKTSQGRRVLEKLIKRADVVTINATSQQLTDIGLDADSIAALNPEAVLCQVDALGGPNGGPWRNRLGYDEIAQAVTGVMARLGGGPQTPEDHMDVGTVDVLTGYAGALATAVALYARRRGVNAHLARASLVATGQLIQLPFMYDHADRTPFDEPSGLDVLGTGPLYRCYEAADGWLFLACQAGDLPTLTSELRIDVAAEDSHLDQALERAFASEQVDAVVARLRALGIAAQRLETVERVRARFMAVADGGSGTADTTLIYRRDQDHPMGHPVELIGRCAVRSTRAVITAPTAAPKPGADTRAILAELGYAEHDIHKMIEAREISESWSEEYLPS
ncbi:crotonobetainyl-CoA:carnitine CoA-transferase CaiB-like acyl-CoA transferase [Bradyrhizobium sp. LB7.1]